QDRALERRQEFQFRRALRAVRSPDRRKRTTESRCRHLARNSRPPQEDRTSGPNCLVEPRRISAEMRRLRQRHRDEYTGQRVRALRGVGCAQTAKRPLACSDVAGLVLEYRASMEQGEMSRSERETAV